MTYGRRVHTVMICEGTCMQCQKPNYRWIFVKVGHGDLDSVEFMTWGSGLHTVMDSEVRWEGCTNA